MTTDDKLPALLEFIKKHNFHLQKHSPRAWGTFEVAFSNGTGNQWFSVPNTPWGWGFSLHEGAAMTLQLIPGNEKHEEFFKLYFGQERLNELKQIVLGIP